MYRKKGTFILGRLVKDNVCYVLFTKAPRNIQCLEWYKHNFNEVASYDMDMNYDIVIRVKLPDSGSVIYMLALRDLF